MNGGTAQAFGEFNVWDQLGDKNAKTAFANLQGTNPTTVTSLLGGSWAQFKAGISGQVTRNVSAFATLDADIGLDHTGYAVGGHVGIRVEF
jgi:outer membrane autotransporter protein